MRKIKAILIGSPVFHWSFNEALKCSKNIPTVKLSSCCQDRAKNKYYERHEHGRGGMKPRMPISGALNNADIRAECARCARGAHKSILVHNLENRVPWRWSVNCEKVEKSVLAHIGPVLLISGASGALHLIGNFIQPGSLSVVCLKAFSWDFMWLIDEVVHLQFG